MGYIKAQASTFGAQLGSKKRIKNFLNCFFIHTTAIVFNFQNYVLQPVAVNCNAQLYPWVAMLCSLDGVNQ